MAAPVLKKSPLTIVVCEVRFGEAQVDQDLVVALKGDLQELGLATYSEEKGIHVTLAGPGDLSQTSITRHRLSSHDGLRHLAIDGSIFTYETADYQGIEHFLEQWEVVASAVVARLGLRTRTRIGLRYVNEVRLKGDRFEDVAWSVTESLLPAWQQHPTLEKLIVSLQELRFREDEGELTFRHGLQRAAQEAPPIYVLDFDRYEQELRNLEVTEEVLRLRQFNADVKSTFEWAITKEQYDEFEPQEEKPVD